jgi:hypothetical protein
VAGMTTPRKPGSLRAPVHVTIAKGLTCPACHGPRDPKRGAHGWCDNCTRRWYKAGRPETGPPPPVSHAERAARSAATHRAQKAERLSWYAEARELGFTPAEAAADAGVTEAHARRRYEPAYRAAARGERAA